MARLKSLKKLCMYSLLRKGSYNMDILIEDLKQEIGVFKNGLLDFNAPDLAKKCRFNKNLARFVIANKEMYSKLYPSQSYNPLTEEFKVDPSGYIYDLFCYHHDLYVKCKQEKHPMLTKLTEHQSKSLEKMVKYRADNIAWESKRLAINNRRL
jgi:hypothetical protein